MSLIQFYQGNHFNQRGRPLIMMSAIHNGSVGSGEVFVFFRKFLTHSYELVKSIKMEFNAEGQMMDLFDVSNQEEFVVAELRDWTEEYLRSEQEKDFLASREPMVLNTIELKQETAWETTLVLMRLRGLADAQIVEIANRTSDATLKGFLNRLKTLQPQQLREM